ncbi:hypothetical protein NEF87_002732 [Candidatus Lokiarchaeum ossiferum]|uniref:Uncharacterized protein n=1 Tax=Candidatus Lokiarchaeum ossiferum TaxID=2951803 RepID=A0ABY6HVR2_9ARCH|nr:hypothetical protein NEF87_002732 [Candidatus Lokiarchaeum sp. B-35]
MMSRKSISISILLLFSVSIISSSILMGSAQSGNWSRTEIISNNLSNSPEINGNIDDSWLAEGINSSVCYLDLQFKLFVQHDENNLYFLIETDFICTSSSETFSIQISSDNSSENFYDKKQITMLNADEKGNETSTSQDLFLSDGEYVTDSDASSTVSFEGKARYSNTTNPETRYYEFKVKSNSTNSSQDAIIVGRGTYAIKVGLNFTNEVIYESDPLLIQIGRESSATDDTVIEVDINVEKYIIIVMISVSSIFVVYGLVLMSSKSKVGEIREGGK